MSEPETFVFRERHGAPLGSRPAPDSAPVEDAARPASSREGMCRFEPTTQTEERIYDRRRIRCRQARAAE